MAVIEINRDPSPKALRAFGLLLAVFCGLVGLLLAWRFDAPVAARWVWITGGGLAVLYYAVPPLRLPMYRGWLYLFFPVGWVLSHVLLAVIYYLVLTPIGLVRRVVGKDPMARSFDPAASTYWTAHRARQDPDRYFRQF